MVSLGELINNQKPTTHFIDSWSNSLCVLLSVWVQCVFLKRLIIYSKLYFSCILQRSWMVLYTLLIWPCFHRPVVVTLTVFHCTDTLHRRRKGNLWNKIGTATLLSWRMFSLLTCITCLIPIWLLISLPHRLLNWRHKWAKLTDTESKLLWLL